MTSFKMLTWAVMNAHKGQYGYPQGLIWVHASGPLWVLNYEQHQPSKTCNNSLSNIRYYPVQSVQTTIFCYPLLNKEQEF